MHPQVHRTLERWRLSFHKRLRHLRGQTYFVKRLRGRWYLLDTSNNVDRRIDALGHFEPAQMNCFISLLERFRPHRFLDIGAHWGLYSLEVALHPMLRDAKVTAFEPDPLNRAQLYAQVFLNRLEDLEVQPVGLSDADTSAAFDRGGDHNRGASILSDDGSRTVEIRRLDGLMQPTGEKIALKIDVEGHEEKAIAGMTRLLGDNECLMQVEAFGDSPVARLSAALGPAFRHLGTIGDDHYFTNVRSADGLVLDPTIRTDRTTSGNTDS